MSHPLTVIIPTHGRPDLLVRTLDSLAACRLPEEYGGTVIVENGPPAGAAAVVAEIGAAHPALGLRYLHVDQANKSHALNVAVASVGSGLVVFFDDDVRVHPEAVAAYAEAARGTDGGTFYGSSFAVEYEEAPPPWLLPLLPYSARGMELSSEDRLWEYLGFSWAAFAEDVQRVGGFDPAFGPGSPTGAMGQETNIQQRLAAAGVARHDLPDVLVWHYVPKERSSSRWAMHRKYKSGISASLRDESALRVIRRALSMGARSCAAMVYKTLQGDRTERWRALGGVYFSVGLLRGLIVKRTA